MSALSLARSKDLTFAKRRSLSTSGFCALLRSRPRNDAELPLRRPQSGSLVHLDSIGSVMRSYGRLYDYAQRLSCLRDIMLCPAFQVTLLLPRKYYILTALADEQTSISPASTNKRSASWQLRSASCNEFEHLSIHLHLAISRNDCELYSELARVAPSIARFVFCSFTRFDQNRQSDFCYGIYPLHSAQSSPFSSLVCVQYAYVCRVADRSKGSCQRPL